MADAAGRALLLVAGLWVVAGVAYDLLLSVVVPRPSPGNWRISTLVLRGSWYFWRWVGLRVRSEQRESILGSFAPLMIIWLLVIWVVLLALGYGAVLWALRDQLRPPPTGFGTALYLSAVSLLTLGFGDIVPTGAAARLAVLAAAGTGLGTVALVISMLFSLFASFQRREVLVITLDPAAGAPPSGVLLLETARKLRMPELLDRTFEEWKAWSADVLDSHLAYPMLNYFRSSHDNESWVSALGAVLDAATLLMTTVEGERTGQAKLMFKVGAHLVEDLSHFFSFPHLHEVGVERFEFDEACRRLEAAGYRLRPGDRAWADFVDLRSEYAAPLNEMARYWVIPPAQWIGDRSMLRFAHQAHQVHD
jgi:Ion channel